jgi:hypothetical protein
VLWVADITYLRNAEGWLYLAAVQDAHSGQIVGWSMTIHMRANLVGNALQMALGGRRPSPGPIDHSDQDSQNVSLACGRAARQAGIAISMGSRGDAYDNAVAETFFVTLKRNSSTGRPRPSRLELQSAVFEHIEAFHNCHGRHSTLGIVPPADYEQTQTRATSINTKPTKHLSNPCRPKRQVRQPCCTSVRSRKRLRFAAPRLEGRQAGDAELGIDYPPLGLLLEPLGQRIERCSVQP